MNSLPQSLRWQKADATKARYIAALRSQFCFWSRVGMRRTLL
jgi:hypothetical protein